MAENPQSIEKQELTVLVYNASDNPLAPLLVSELKAIKDAGFQQHTNVIVYFDPMSKRMTPQVYEVNRERKKVARENSDEPELQDRIGDGENSFVRKIQEDLIPEEELKEALGEKTEALRETTKGEGETTKGEVDAFTSLKTFVEFGIKEYAAEKYILFLIGHGMIVGNNSFLPDEDPVSAITLENLKEVLKQFTKDGSTKLSLLYMHSCSMSSLEVIYQLHGLVDYMIANQGPTFVNNVSFRQVLKKVLKQVKEVKDQARKKAGAAQNAIQAVNGAHVDMGELVHKMFDHSMHNNSDFITVGYSADIALCDLRRVKQIKEPLQKLVNRLNKNLRSPVSVIKDLVLLAHWESQSFYSENYTDLYDFCDCLAKRCAGQMTALVDRKFLSGELEELATPIDDERLSDDLKKLPILLGNAKLRDELGELAKECKAVQQAIRSSDPEADPAGFHFENQGIVLREENQGMTYPFARGLSVYFPWCEPLDDQRPGIKIRKKSGEKREKSSEEYAKKERVANENRIMENYLKYDFNTDLGDDSWGNFLVTYFKETMRKLGPGDVGFLNTGHRARQAFIDGTLQQKPTPEMQQKRTPEFGTRTPEHGADCECPSIKNYPTEANDIPGEGKCKTRKVSMTEGARKAFEELSDDAQ